MTEKDSKEYINFGIECANIVRSTLGPRGMNKMIVTDKNIMSNDGATIINSLPKGNPIIEMFKNLAISQEEAIGDGTTTASVLTGQLLQNALILINKGIHPTVIINGYNLALARTLSYLNTIKEKPDKIKIIKTAFGSKISINLVEHLTELIMRVKDYKGLRVFKVNNSDPMKSELYRGHVFEGFTLNDRMKSEIKGNIAVLDFPINLKVDNFSVTNAEELEKIEQYDTKKIRNIVDKLKECKVDCLFYTDTTPEFENYLTEKGITGIVVYQREHLDRICLSTGAVSISGVDKIVPENIGTGEIKYVKAQKKRDSIIYVKGDTETLILHGSTNQVLDEIDRSVHDVVSLMKHELDMVIGAGAVEIRISKDLDDFAKQVGGKEQLAIEKFAESIEAIPMILAENCGLDAIEVLTSLKTIHNENTDFGVDPVLKISDARDRGIIEPVLVKMHAINSATNVANSILKLDKIIQGENGND